MEKVDPMTQVSFNDDDVAGLQARLEGLELPAGQRAALDQLVALAGEAATEVSGFASGQAAIPAIKGRAGLGDLTGFLSSGHTTGSNLTDFKEGSPVIASGGGNEI